MALTIGTKLGSYEVLSQIGAGGMGEVYQAHDTKLGRDVAIKVLPEAFAHDAERLSRFQREAKMLAALNHPNIATIFGLEHSDGVQYLVMELVSGETLQERVRRDGAVPIEEALNIAKQIAEALEAAHEKGIIHRDLKPANVKVTHEGKVKVLDFGLAKAFAGDTSTEDMGNSPTLSMAATMQGVILGTAAYMSPEQAKGKPVTKATDIWAFGCVLYELLSGHPAFEGDDTAEILAAVVRTEPDWNRLPESTPQSIRLLLRRCLRKDRRQRFQDATDVRIEIEDALSAPASVVPTVPEVHRGAIWRWAMLSGLALLIVAAITGLAVWNLKPKPSVPVIRSIFVLPPGQRLPDLAQQAVALSPDGKQLVYVAIAGGTQQLYLRSMDSFDAKAIPGTEGGTAPFFSPDSQWLGFFAAHKLKKISISGGATVTLCDVADLRGATWGPNDTIVLSPTAAGGLSVVSAAGGTLQPLTTLDSKKREISHRWPEFLPSGGAMVFNSSNANTPFSEARVVLYVLKTKELRDIFQVGTRPRYAPSGHLLYVQGGTLTAMPFDMGRLQITGAAVPIVEGVSQSLLTGAAQYSFSDRGTIVYIPGGNQATQRSNLVWVDRKGAEQHIAAPAHNFVRPRVSPDGRRVAVAILESGMQIWIYDLSRETLTRLTFDGSTNLDAAWTPDGKRITFESASPGNLFWQPADGSGKAERLTTNEHSQVPNSWSPDGQVLAFTEVTPATGRDLWTLRLSDRKPLVFLQTQFNEGAPMFSPDGRWLVYGSDESSRPEIYVQPYPGPGGKWQISTDGGTEPAWNHNGRELFYRQGNKMMAVDVTTLPTFSAGKPRMLFEGQYAPSTTPSSRNYDVSPDGQRFLMVKTVEQEQPTAQINVVLNWFEELKQKVPTGKKVMGLATGTKLGSYEVLSQIGAGGMGEVYHAHDTKLGRDVAIKVLPEAFAHDPERLSRFQHEAKMLAALNHPNIATIYGLEHSDGVQYLVMELVPGETLADRIKREGAVPVEESLAIAKQIAEALEAAHEKGIIHRDLKPANVKLTPEGKVKVLDFGLAKAFAGDSTTEDMSNSPTLSMAATIQGVILGTAAYMSPEQAKGKAVDKRTDVWAFGAVLYELLTGKAAFHGEDITDILAAVVRAEPDWQALPAATPVKVRDLLRRCLQKDKTQRFRDAGDARIEIHEALADPAERVSAIAGGLSWTWRQAAILGLAALLLLCVGGITVWKLMPTPAQPITRTVITLPPGDQLAAFDYPAIALSPDGTQLAYVAIRGGTRQVFLRRLDSLEARPLAGTEGANTPFFSPDGHWLGFFAGGKLKKISVSGGATLILADAAVPRGASWANNGTIIFAPSTFSGLQQVLDGGSDPQPLTHLDESETSHRFPDFLPNDKVLFAAVGPNNKQVVAAQSLATGERRDVFTGGISPRYAASGHLIYAQGANLMAVPFDPQRLQVTGPAVPMEEGILPLVGDRASQYSISATGSLAYIPGGAQALAERLVWVGRNGTEQLLATALHNYVAPRLSPDGRRVAVTVTDQENQIWLCDIARDTETRLTFEGTTNQPPVWTPDGNRIAFYSNKVRAQNLAWQRADGSGGLERLPTSEYTHVPTSFSRDGQLLAFAEIHPTTGFDIWVLSLSDHKAKPFLRTPFNEAMPIFSPDGRWMAYISDESGRYEVYVQPYPGPGGKYQISTEGGTEPVWNRNGKELFYRGGDKMMAAEVETQPSFSVSKPRMLFAGPYVPATLTTPNYDVSPDGQRFLMLKPNEQAGAVTQIVVVQNWFEELKQKVPTGKK